MMLLKSGVYIIIPEYTSANYQQIFSGLYSDEVKRNILYLILYLISFYILVMMRQNAVKEGFGEIL